MKKKLLIVTNRFYPQLGGAEINIMQQAVTLSKDYDVEVVTPLRDRNPPKEIVNHITITRLHDLRHPLLFPNNEAQTLCPSLFFKILTGNYDLIHCFPAINDNNLLALLAAKIRRVPIYLSNFDLFDYAAHLKKYPNDLAGLYKIPLGRKQKMFLPFFDAIFTISQRENDLISSLNPRTYLSTVPITLEEFNRPLPLEDICIKYHLRDVPRFLTLSRVSYLKGQDILLRALPDLKQALDDFQVILVGDENHEPQFVEELKTFVRTHQLEDHVIFTGALPREEALSLLKLCDIHVLPMRYMNSGAVVVESWAAEKPVLQSRRIDPTYVLEGINGYTFDIENIEDLTNKMVTMANNLSKCKEMGKCGRTLVEEKFLYPHLITLYEQHYSRLDKSSL